MDGEMTIHYQNGDRFRGTYRNGKRNGPAKEQTKDGKFFEGTYVNGERDGKFVEKDRNGHVTARGEYRNGRRIAE